MLSKITCIKKEESYHYIVESIEKCITTSRGSIVSRYSLNENQLSFYRIFPRQTVLFFWKSVIGEMIPVYGVPFFFFYTKVRAGVINSGSLLVFEFWSVYTFFHGDVKTKRIVPLFRPGSLLVQFLHWYVYSTLTNLVSWGFLRFRFHGLFRLSKSPWESIQFLPQGYLWNFYVTRLTFILMLYGLNSLCLFCHDSPFRYRNLR